MTNAMIMLMESVKLMEEGILKPTGEKITVENADGTTKELDVPETIHTYAKWKALGYQVQKGEKAIAQFPIWKYCKGKKAQEEEADIDGEEATQNGFCRMVKASFFTFAQVKPIEA